MLVHRFFYTANTTNPEEAQQTFIQLLLDKGYAQTQIDEMHIIVVDSCLLNQNVRCYVDAWFVE